MKKNVFLDLRAQKEFDQFSRQVQIMFLGLMHVLEEEGMLGPPDAKKVGKNIFEMRVLAGGAHRGFYAYLIHNRIVVLHFFQKKTQRIPLNHLRCAIERLSHYE